MKDFKISHEFLSNQKSNFFQIIDTITTNFYRKKICRNKIIMLDGLKAKAYSLH